MHAHHAPSVTLRCAFRVANPAHALALACKHTDARAHMHCTTQARTQVPVCAAHVGRALHSHGCTAQPGNHSSLPAAVPPSSRRSRSGILTPAATLRIFARALTCWTRRHTGRRAGTRGAPSEAPTMTHPSARKARAACPAGSPECADMLQHAATRCSMLQRGAT
jgi:hypothetical protein